MKGERNGTSARPRALRSRSGGLSVTNARRDQSLLMTFSKWEAGARLTRASRSLFRSEEHTSELQSLMRISSAVFCLKQKIHSLLHKRTALEPYLTKLQQHTDSCEAQVPVFCYSHKSKLRHHNN